MPTVKFSKQIILELLGRKISDQELQNRINYMGANVEGIEGDELSVEIFPNRPDMLSEQGLARALKTFLGIKPGFKEYTVKKSAVKVIVDKSVKNIRPYTACAVVKGLKLTDEKIKTIIQTQEKLHITYGRNRKKAAIGIYPLEHIKPPIYYKALYPEEIKFKPLDMNKDLLGSQILAIHPTGREYGHLLEGLEKFPVFLDSKSNIMSMPPIINSNNVGKVTSTTKDVFIECSGFDLDYLHTCLNIIVTSLADMGGEIYSVDMHYPDKKKIMPNLSGREMKIDKGYVNKILGLNLKDEDMKLLLEKMGIGYKNKNAVIPGYRADVLHPIDLVEDIAVAYGYENFKSEIPKAATVASERSLDIFNNKIRETLIGAGLIEVKNYQLTSKDFQCKFMNFDTELVELENSVTQDYNVLRYWMIPSLLQVLKENKHYEYPQNIFEIGVVFRIDDTYDTKVQETERLAIVFAGNDANFTKVKQMLDILMESLNIKYSVLETEHKSFIKGRVGRVAVNSEKIAYIGEIHPQVLSNWGIDMPVSAIEINITDLFRLMNLSSDANIENNYSKTKNTEKTRDFSSSIKTVKTIKTEETITEISENNVKSGEKKAKKHNLKKHKKNSDRKIISKKNIRKKEPAEKKRFKKYSEKKVAKKKIKKQFKR